jgi:hypothetical protein
MGGRYRHPDEMIDDLTHEQWCGWLNYFRNDPWDEERKDDRNAVNVLWSVAPHIHSDEELKLPGFTGPEYSAERPDDFSASVARVNALMKRLAQKQLDGQLNSKTSDPANG